MGVAGWRPAAAAGVQAGQPVFLPLAPSMGWASTQSQVLEHELERERENTETALVEVRDGDSLLPPPHPAPPRSTILPIFPSETKNKNVEKSLYRSPVGNGVGMLALSGAYSPQIFTTHVHGSKTKFERAVLGHGPAPARARWVLRRLAAAPG